MPYPSRKIRRICACTHQRPRRIHNQYVIWYDEDVHDLRSVETEFPTIVLNDSLTSNETPSCEPTVSSLNDNEIDFRISFDESEDEDYTPTISCFDDLDFFKDFENEFPAIVYNNALTSKSDFLTKPTLKPQHIDEFNLKDETSLSECDEGEQNVLYFNDLFSFNVIYPDDSKLNEDNDDDKIDIEHSLGDLSVKPLLDCAGDVVDFRTWLGISGLQYIDADFVDFEERLELMEEGLSGRMLMEHKDAQGQGVFTSRAWRRLFEIKGLLGFHLLDFLGTALSYTSIRDPMLRLCHRLIACSIAGRSQAPKKVTVADLFHLRGMNVGLVNIPYLLARYLRLFTSRRKRKAMISRDLPVIDMAELVRLQICKELDDTWVWVASGPERQPDDAAGTLEVTEGAPDVVKVEEDENEIRGALEEHEVMDVMARDLSRFTVWAARGISQLLDTAGATYKKTGIIMEYLVKINKKARILELKRRYFEDYCSDNQYAVSIKEDMAYLCLHSPKTTKETRSICLIQEKQIRCGRHGTRAQLNNLGREIKKVNENVYASQVGCEHCKGPHYTKDFSLKEEGKPLEEAYYTQFGAPFQGGGYRAATLRSYQRRNANPLYQERRQSMEEPLSNFMSEIAKRQEENSNMIKEIRALTDAANRN
ncbi:hypothetical protein Tco_0429753 [Tanacetum coccineum]